jgi:DNA-binding protein H-NS
MKKYINNQHQIEATVAKYEEHKEMMMYYNISDHLAAD